MAECSRRTLTASAGSQLNRMHLKLLHTPKKTRHSNMITITALASAPVGCARRREGMKSNILRFFTVLIFFKSSLLECFLSKIVNKVLTVLTVAQVHLQTCQGARSPLYGSHRQVLALSSIEITNSQRTTQTAKKSTSFDILNG